MALTFTLNVPLKLRNLLDLLPSSGWWVPDVRRPEPLRSDCDLKSFGKIHRIVGRQEQIIAVFISTLLHIAARPLFQDTSLVLAIT